MRKLLSSIFLLLCILLCADNAFTNFAREKYWLDKYEYPPVTKEALVQAIELGRSYFLNQQKSDGNFVYMLDLQNGETVHKDNAVRQAGALWALCSLCRDRYNEPTGKAARLGIDFFAKNVITLANGTQCARYPGNPAISTGTPALLSLALIEYIRGRGQYMEADLRLKYQGLLDTHLNYLKSMEMPNGSWSAMYEIEHGLQSTKTSGYYDGETLLAYIKAAKYMGRSDLIPRIEMAIPMLLKKYTLDCWGPGGDANTSKAFSQWSMMAMWEYYDADWNTHDALIADAIQAYGWWAIHSNKLEARSGNTGYAIEGLIGVHNVLEAAGRKEDAAKVHAVIMRIMSRLLTLQCGSPLSKYNDALAAITKLPDGAAGGIINAEDDPRVRIDTHQHQMHAMLMLLKLLSK